MELILFIVIMLARTSVLAPESYLPSTALYVSSDAAATFTEIPTNYRIIDLEFDPHNDQRLVALSAETETIQLIDSHDNGNTWKTIGTIPAVPFRDLESYHLYLPSSCSSIFVFGRYLYRVSNQQIAKCPLEHVKAMASSPVSSRLIASGYFFDSRNSYTRAVCSSHDDGLTWSFLTGQLFYSFLWLSNEQVIIGGLRGTAAVSRDDGKTWLRSDDCFAGGSLVNRLSVGENSVFAICALGCFESKNLGLDWQPLLQFETRCPYYRAMAVPAKQDKTIYAAWAGALFFTRDHGATWEKTTSFRYDIQEIIIDPKNPRQVYVLCVDPWGD